MPCLEFANGTKPDQSGVQNFTLGRDVFSVKFEMAQFVATPGGFLVIYTGQAATGQAFYMSMYYSFKGEWLAKFIDRAPEQQPHSSRLAN